VTAFAAIIDGPVTAASLRPLIDARLGSGGDGLAGALLTFQGVVRRAEPHNGATRPLAALDYTAYLPMAQRELLSLAQATLQRHALTACLTIHSKGRVPVGEVSFHLEVAAPHRAQAIAGLADFIDRLKQDVPIWKQPVWA